MISCVKCPARTATRMRALRPRMTTRGKCEVFRRSPSWHGFRKLHPQALHGRSLDSARKLEAAAPACLPCKSTRCVFAAVDIQALYVPGRFLRGCRQLGRALVRASSQAVLTCSSSSQWESWKRRAGCSVIVVISGEGYPSPRLRLLKRTSLGTLEYV